MSKEDFNKNAAGSTSGADGGKTLFEKIWDKHVVSSIKDGPDVLYIDKHFIHEVTSPQAFAGIGKKRPESFPAASRW